MADNRGWNYWSRCDLFLTIRVLALGSTTAEEAGCCLHKILEELELYLDPDAGKNFYYNDNEWPILDQIAITMNSIVENDYPALSGRKAIDHLQWPEVVKLAQQILPIIKKNGLGPTNLK